MVRPYMDYGSCLFNCSCPCKCHRGFFWIGIIHICLPVFRLIQAKFLIIVALPGARINTTISEHPKTYDDGFVSPGWDSPFSLFFTVFFSIFGGTAGLTYMICSFTKNLQMMWVPLIMNWLLVIFYIPITLSSKLGFATTTLICSEVFIQFTLGIVSLLLMYLPQAEREEDIEERRRRMRRVREQASRITRMTPQEIHEMVGGQGQSVAPTPTGSDHPLQQQEEV